LQSTSRHEPALARWLPYLSIAAGILLVLQAFLAGRGYFRDPDLIEIHGYVGELTFLVAIGMIISAWLGRASGRYGQTELGLAVATLVLVVAQLGLGFSTRDNLTLVAWHIANSILITGTVSAVIALTLRRPVSAG